MPYFDSPSLYIDFSQLPAPSVVETIDYETLLTAYQARVVAANSDLTAAVTLQQSATNIILQAEAYGEMLLRARVNAAAKAVMLPFAVKSDLDNLAALYNVMRMTNPDGTAELDDRFRRRIQLSPEAFSTAGTPGSYIFQALSADATIRDISATKINTTGGVQITVMNSDPATPVPTSSQISNVITQLNQDNIKVLTDVVSVRAPHVFYTTIAATLTLYPGPDASIVLANAQAALTALRSRLAQLGRSLSRSSIITALSQEGVEDVALTTPPANINTDPTQCVWITGATINVSPTRAE